MAEQITSSLLEKIANIKALSDQAGTLAEAEAAGAALSRLLFKHNLELADLDQFMNRERVAPEKQDFDIGSKEFWQRDLVFGLARAHMCRGLYYRGRTGVVLVGHAHNLVAVKEMFLYLRDEILRLSKGALKEAKSLPYPPPVDPGDFGLTEEESQSHAWPPSDTLLAYRKAVSDRRALIESIMTARDSGKSWANSFKTGAVYGVLKKIRDERESLKAEVGENTWALVPAMEKEVDDLLVKLFPKLSSSSHNVSLNKGAYNAGFNAGGGINTSRQVGGGGAYRQIG